MSTGTEYFDFDPLQPFATARANDVNAIASAVQGGFDKLPPAARLASDSITYGVDTGTANTLAVALPTPLTAYVEGALIVVRAAAENTGAATINVDGLGAKTIIRSDGTSIEPGDIRADQIVELRYDGTSFRLLANVVTVNQEGLDLILAGAQELADEAASSAEAATAAANAAQAVAVNYTAADVLAKLITVDGSGSGIDADRLRGTTPSATGLSMLAAASATAVKTTLGVNNVDNTSDANKPISSAAQSALNLKAPIASPTFTGSVTLPGDPTADLHAATKGWVQTSIAGLTNTQAKASVVLATTGNITLSGEQTIDGTLTSGTAVLVKNQNTASQNGIYTSAAGTWARRSDADSWAELEFAETVVTGGATNSGTRWQQVATGGSLGSSALTWVLRDAAPIYTASGGISKSGADFRLANMAAGTIKGNNTGGSAAPSDLSAAQATAMLDQFGASKGLAPGVVATGAKYLGDGGWVSALTPASVAASGTVTGSNLSGTNTGDQTITLTGNVTGSGTGSFVTTIANDAVANAKLANMATATIKGRRTAGTGDPEDIALADLKTDLSLSGTNTGDQTTVSGNAGTATTLQTARTIAISGGVTGTATSFNGSANITIPVTAVDVAYLSGAVPVANGGTGATATTGSGNNVLSASPTFTGSVALASAAASGQITVAGGANATPSYSFAGDTNTGITTPGADTLRVVAGGTAVADFSGTTVEISLPTRIYGQTTGPLGSASAPSYSFTGDVNTGMYEIAADNIGFATGGVARLGISTTAITPVLPVTAALGSASAPAFSFSGDTDTGIYSSGANTINLTTGGVSRFAVSTTAIAPAMPFTAQLSSASAPTYSFAGNTNTGMYAAGIGSISFSTAGVYRLGIDALGITSTVPIRAPYGTAFAPGISFDGAPATGLFGATHNLGIIVGGFTSASLDSVGTLTCVDLVETSDERTKVDIRTIESGLDKVLAMRGVTFVRKESGWKSAGIVAQDLRRAAPELVHEGDDGLLTVKHSGIIGYLIEAVRELSAEIQMLRRPQ